MESIHTLVGSAGVPLSHHQHHNHNQQQHQQQQVTTLAATSNNNKNNKPTLMHQFQQFQQQPQQQQQHHHQTPSNGNSNSPSPFVVSNSSASTTSSSANNSNTSTNAPNVQLLQFQQHHQHHHQPYATLHNQLHLSQNQLASNLHQASQTMHFGSMAAINQQLNSNANNPQIMGHQLQQQQQLLNQQHHQQQQQPPPVQHHQQQAYNMNSDYSSSTYHIYDQISDLIIIKQQRMERKRQLEHRRKVIFLCLAAILLVATSLFLLLQSIYSSNNTNPAATTSSNQQPILDSSALKRPTYANTGGSPNDVLLSTWAPPGASNINIFEASQYNRRLQQQQQQQQHQVILQQSTNQDADCSQRGQLIQISADSFMCKCEPGFWGDRCQEVVTPSLTNTPIGLCLLTNCQSNGGKCHQSGRCQCLPGLFGPQCEFRMPAAAAALPSETLGRLTPAATQQQQQRPLSSSASSQPSSAIEQATQPRPSTVTSGGSSSINFDPQQQQQPTQCPLNCNGQGQCQPNGQCLCLAGFIGDSCQERDLCFERNCSNQGVCLQATGSCQCKFGYRGTNCELRDDDQWARLFNCSSRGHFDLQTRKCICDQGFVGLDCGEELDNQQQQQQQQQCAEFKTTNCGPNGLYDCRQSRCVCQDGYSGDRCQLQQCSAQCLRNGGQCVQGQCKCPVGFYGRHCTLNGCPNSCSNRGHCERVVAVVVASSTATIEQPEWQCKCRPGATGDDCGQLVERQCDDGLDNDQDGLIDCADSECCGDKVCQNSTFCMKSPDPLDILLRKQPPPPTSSFFQRMQFLIEKFSSQIYTNAKDFNDSILATKYFDRASVIRGRVTYLKQGVTGVRVSVAGQINLGITLTRDGGHFDLMVNGGGAVVLEFQREPFGKMQKTIRVPWNEIVLVDPVELQLESSSSSSSATTSSSDNKQQQQLDNTDGQLPTCLAHNYRLLRPLITVAPKTWRRSSSQVTTTTSQPVARQHQQATAKQQQQPISPRAVILRDSQMVQQSVVLPNSANQVDLDNNSQQNQSVSLVYISSRANEYMSTIQIQLTPPPQQHPHQQQQQQQQQQQLNQIPDELKLIHAKIIIEGNLFEQVFEPQMNLSFTYAWNRRNVYKQKSFGLSTATISVGYEYFDCRHVIWSTKQIQLAGHDLSISDIGNQWNLNIHHRFNYRDSILQRGDGLNYNLKTDKPRVVQSLMGDGYARQAVCPYCDGATGPSDQRLYRPQALVSGPDGSLYVGDFNLIRRIDPPLQQQQSERLVRTLLELPTNKVPARYSLALNPVDQRLYMTDSDNYKIYLIKDSLAGSRVDQLLLTTTLASNQLNDSSSGAGGAGAGLNQDDQNNMVVVVGTGQRCQPDDRSNCGDGQLARQARLVEPRALVFDLQSRLYIADGATVRMVDSDQRIYTLLGDHVAAAAGSTSSAGQQQRQRPLFPCSGEAIPMHKFAPKSPLDLAVNPLDETLHLLDDNVVYKVTQDKRVQVVAGRPAHCDSAGQHPTVSPRSGQLRATEFPLQAAQSIVFNQNGELLISEDDQAKQISRVLLVSPEDDTVSLYAGLASDLPADQQLLLGALQADHQQHTLGATSSGNSAKQLLATLISGTSGTSTSNNNNDNTKQRSSNVLPLSQQTRATEYKFGSIGAIAVDQQGHLLVADRLQLRLLSVEPDLPQLNQAGEYELQSPDNPDELLVFNRHGHHVATRDLISSQAHRQANKFLFTYNVNTSFGQLASVSYSNGNKLSIYRDGPHHTVKMIETAFGGQCKLDIGRSGQVNSIATLGASQHGGQQATKVSLAYHSEGGLLRQSRDQASGEVYELQYDEFGRATTIQHSSPRLAAPIECRLAGAPSAPAANQVALRQAHHHLGAGQQCSSLIVAE